MSTDYPIFYKEMATGMDEMLVSLNVNLDPIERVLDLLKYIIDLTTSVDYNVSQTVVDIEPVMRTGVYSGLTENAKDELQIFKGVKAVNEHTKKFINSDLTDFVNNEVWPSDCVPFEWARASGITGEDISGWNVCDPS